MRLSQAEEKDLPEILKLQYLAYQSEAELLGNPHILPLTQTLAEVEAQFRDGFAFLKAVEEETGRIIGSVRANVTDGTLFVGKLFVHPDFRGLGIGSQLLREIEKQLPHTRCELFTSARSVRNLQLYERCGYVRFREVTGIENVPMVFLEK